MRHSSKLSDSIHIMSFIHLFPTKILSSKNISESLNTNPAVVRRIMAQLKKSGLIHTKVGVANPTLTRSPEEITLLDIYQSVEGESRFFYVNPNTNVNCSVGAVIQDVLTNQYDAFQKLMEDELAEHTLSEVIVDMKIVGKFDKTD